jgi:DNA-binding transcriptional LysR family regulator
VSTTRGNPAAPPIPAPRTGAAELRAFVAVARSGSVGRGAELLDRAQPSVSARIASLEAAWKTRLFRRVARGMELTPEGARLLPASESILRDLEELDRAAGLPVAPRRELRVGSGDALGRRVLPGALATLLREQPDLEIHLREGTGSHLIDALRDGEIDLALVVAPTGTAQPEEIDIAPITSSSIVLLVPEGRRGDPQRKVRLKSLGQERLVALQPGSGFRRHLERAFLAEGLDFRPAVEVGNLSLVRRFVAAGLGVAPVPAIAFSESVRLTGCETRRLGGLQEVTYLRAVRQHAPIPPPVIRLLRLLESAG